MTVTSSSVTGSPYAVSPGRVTKDDGTPFKVYSAFYRKWRDHGWRKPAATITGRVDWHSGLSSVDIPADPRLPKDLELPDAGGELLPARDGVHFPLTDDEMLWHLNYFGIEA